MWVEMEKGISSLYILEDDSYLQLLLHGLLHGQTAQSFQAEV